MNTQELNEMISAAQAAADALYEKLALLEERMNETIQRSQEILDDSISAADLLTNEADRISRVEMQPGPGADFVSAVAHGYRVSAAMLQTMDDQSRIRRFVEVQP
jgi:hypothetical protein